MTRHRESGSSFLEPGAFLSRKKLREMSTLRLKHWVEAQLKVGKYVFRL